jgi:hypothetical protein
MTFTDAVKMGAAIVAGMGGGGAIALGLASFFGKFWADKFLERERAEYQRLNAQLQHDLDLATRRIQIELDAVGLMHKLRTTEEFSHLGQLWKKMAWLSLTFNQACGTGLRLVPNTQEGMVRYKEGRRQAYLMA